MLLETFMNNKISSSQEGRHLTLFFLSYTNYICTKIWRKKNVWCSDSSIRNIPTQRELNEIENMNNLNNL